MSIHSEVEQTEIEQTIDNEEVQTYESLHASIVERINTGYNAFRTAKLDLKTLDKLHRTEMKNSRKHRKSRNNRGQKKPSGFNKSFYRIPVNLLDSKFHRYACTKV